MKGVNYANPKLIVESSTIKEGKISWQSPSNIAIIKYWGKYGQQLPKNASFSFTLDKAFSKTTLSYEARKGADTGVDLKFYFHGKEQPDFEEKIKKYFSSLTDYFPFIKQLKFKINSENSFPHSAGIASSASGMSALALCLCSLEHRLFGTLGDDSSFRQKASYMARLGSGSACRSIYNKGAIWGQTTALEQASNLYAIPYSEKLHPVFNELQDTILLISKSEKSVSSRAGHQLMENNVYAESRYEQARQRFNRLLPALEQGDLEIFGQICEGEALTLHALMMTSNPPYLLMEANTISAIKKVQSFRKEAKLPLYFTLDAGPNLHLLYPKANQEIIKSFIESELAPLCENGKYIEDQVGPGPLEF